MKAVSLEVVQGGGIVRGIHNHGIRDLPHRFKAKFADKQGNRYYSKGRFISVYYDSNPTVMRKVEQQLIMEEEILRNTHLKARSILDYVNIARPEKNPYVRKVDRQRNRMAERAASSANAEPAAPVDDPQEEPAMDLDTPMEDVAEHVVEEKRLESENPGGLPPQKGSV